MGCLRGATVLRLERDDRRDDRHDRHADDGQRSGAPPPGTLHWSGRERGIHVEPRGAVFEQLAELLLNPTLHPASPLSAFAGPGRPAISRCRPRSRSRGASGGWFLSFHTFHYAASAGGVRVRLAEDRLANHQMAWLVWHAWT